MTLRISYLLDQTGISGATRTVLAQADALVARGHRVRIVTTDLPVTWRASRAEWVYIDDFRQYDRRGENAIVTRVSEVVQANPIIDDELFRTRLPRDNDPLRVLIGGASTIAAKAIEDGYGAVAHARWFHQKLDLIRVAPWTPSREEPLDTVQEFHVALTTAEMTRLMHSCDLLIAPPLHEDGVSLTTLEALASGLACVMTAIPAHTAIDPSDDFALFAPEGNAVDLGERLIELASDPALRLRLRNRAREVAAQFRTERVVERLEKIFEPET